MTTPASPDPRKHPRILGYLQPDEAPELHLSEPIPILELRLADQRKWCRAAAAWLAEGVRASRCPTSDLRPDGSCRRSPQGGTCLLLLPFTHPDWEGARRWRYDPDRAAFLEREEAAPLPEGRPPHRLADLAQPDPVLDQLARLEARFEAELAELRAQGYPIQVEARALLQAELAGQMLDLETGEPL